MDIIGITFASLFCIFFIFIFYVTIANDWASDWIFYHELEIKSLCEASNMVFYRGNFYHDMAPCEVQFGLALTCTPENDRKSLPSRKMKRLLINKELAFVVKYVDVHGGYVIPRHKPLVRKVSS